MILPLISYITNLTVGNVWFCLNLYNVQYPDIVLRQSILETGWYRCEDCSMDVNNIFGFYNGSYIRFDHWIESVEYYKKWQDKRMPEICTEQEYYNWLKKVGYATADDYEQKLKGIVL